jgi:hypothetical protein
MRQLLTESLLLAVSGGLLGLLLASATMKLLIAFAEGFTTRASEISLDTNVLLFTLATSVITGLVFGTIPAFSSRLDVAPALRDGSRTTHANQGLRNWLNVGQVAVSFMLLIASGLTLRSLIKLQSVNPGFRTENLMTLRADMSFNKFPLNMPRQQRTQNMANYWERFEGRLRAIPGVIDVGGSGTFPLNELGPFSSGLVRESHPLPPGVQAPQVRRHDRHPRILRDARAADRGGPRVHALRHGIGSRSRDHQSINRAAFLDERGSHRQAHLGRRRRLAHGRRRRRGRSSAAQSSAAGRSLRANAAEPAARHDVDRAFEAQAG